MRASAALSETDIGQSTPQPGPRPAGYIVEVAVKNSKLAWLRHVPFLVLFLSFTVLAACEDETGPEQVTTVDPEAAQSALDSVVSDFFEDNPSVRTTNGPLGGFITAVTGLQPLAPPLLSSSPASPGAMGSRLLDAATLLRFATSPAATPAFASIPTNLVGATCIWNFSSPGWADDTSRRGLCGTGNCIRFALYPLGVDGLPSSQTENGYIDITDETTAGGVGSFNIDVSILSEVDMATLLDYGVTGTLSETMVNLTMSGSVSNGVNQLPLTFTIGGSPVNFSTGFTVTVGGFNVGLDFMSDELSGFSYAFSVVDVQGGDEIEVMVGIDLEGMVTSGSEITLNGETIATLSGTSASVTVTPVQGSGLTEQQIFAFIPLFNAMQGFFTELAGLFAFAMSSTGNTVIIQ